MKHIVIYYIATGAYIRFFKNFLEGLEGFFPNDKKTVVLLTDSIENYESRNSNIAIQRHYIEHFCWPIVALFKMKYILDYYIEDCDYAFYMNANSTWNGNNDLDLTKDLTFAIHYDNEIYPYTAYNEKQIINSKSFIDYNRLPNDIRYCQSGFFGGGGVKMKLFCNEICDMLKKDLSKGIIPTWHDESYLNKWLYDNYWMKEERPNYNIVKMRDYLTLEDKGALWTSFKSGNSSF